MKQICLLCLIRKGNGNKMRSQLSKKLLFTLSVFSLMAMLIFAAEAKTVKQDGFVFDVQSKSAAVVSYSGKAKKVVIPSKVSSVPVTEISKECFWQVRTMTSLSIPNTVTKIGHAAFNECTGLKTVVLPKSLTSLGDSAFWYCSNLSKVVFRSNVKSLGENAFRGCEKVTVYVPKGSNTEKLVKADGTVKFGYTYITKLTAKESIDLVLGNSEPLSPTVSPSSNLLNGELSFSSSDKKVAQVSSKGVIKAVGCGTATITVKAKDGSGKSTKCTVTVKPKAPSKLRQSASTLSSVTVKWNKADGATGYNIYRYDSAKKSWKKLGYTTKATYTVKSLSSNEALGLRVRSVFKSGKTSILSAGVNVDVKSAAVSAVTGLKQSANTLSSVTVKWTAVSGASKYRIQKYDSSKKKWQTLTTTTKTSYTVSKLAPAEKIKLRVRVTFIENKKEYHSKNVSVTVSAASPAAVSNLKKSSSTLSSVTISWSASKDASKYRVSQYDASKKSWTKVAESTKTSYTVSKLLPGESVKLRVAGLFKNGSKTVLGNTKDITVAASDVPSVKDLTLTSKSSSSLSFSWKACTNVDGYNVYGYSSETKKYTFRGTVTKAEYSVSSLKEKTQYAFAVKAFVTISGNKYESKTFSDILSVFTPLSAVNGFSADGNKATRSSIPLSWSAREGAEGYLLNYRKTGEESWSSIALDAEKTAYICTELEAATEYQFRLGAFFKVGDDTVYSDYTDILTVSTFSLPETKKEALDGFVNALENTAAQKDGLFLFKETSLSNQQYLPDEEKFKSVLDSIGKAGTTLYKISDGKDSSGKALGELLPSFAGKEFTVEEAEQYVVSFGGPEKNAYSITLEIPGSSDLAAAFMPDVKTSCRLAGLNATDVDCEKLTVTAKIQNNRLDMLDATVSFTASGLENSTGRTFSLGETVKTLFAFNWK